MLRCVSDVSGRSIAVHGSRRVRSRASLARRAFIARCPPRLSPDGVRPPPIDGRRRRPSQTRRNDGQLRSGRGQGRGGRQPRSATEHLSRLLGQPAQSQPSQQTDGPSEPPNCHYRRVETTSDVSPYVLRRCVMNDPTIKDELGMRRGLVQALIVCLLFRTH